MEIVYRGLTIRTKVYPLRPVGWAKEARICHYDAGKWIEHQILGEIPAPTEELAIAESIRLAKTWIDSN